MKKSVKILIYINNDWQLITVTNCKDCPHNEKDGSWCLHENMNWRDAYNRVRDGYVRRNCLLGLENIDENND